LVFGDQFANNKIGKPTEHDRLSDTLLFAKQLILNLSADDADTLGIRIIAGIDMPSPGDQIDRSHLHVIREDTVRIEGTVVDARTSRHSSLNFGAQPLQICGLILQSEVIVGR
jgi:hypothetical protein